MSDNKEIDRLAEAIAWLKSGEAMMGPRTEKAVYVVLDRLANLARTPSGTGEAMLDEKSRIIAELLDQMHHFANADQRLWDESQRDPESFKSWVRSRAAHLLAKFTDRAATACSAPSTPIQEGE